MLFTITKTTLTSSDSFIIITYILLKVHNVLENIEKNKLAVQESGQSWFLFKNN